METKATVNILGTCISRDTFSTHPNDGGYKVLKYVHEFEPFHFVCKGLEIDKQKYDAFDVSDKITNFRKRCMYLDATKKVMDYIKEAESDYLVIDSALFRITSMRWGDTIVCVSNHRQKFFEALNKKGVLKEKFEEIVYVPNEEFEERLEDFAQEVLKIYPPEKIILVEVRGVFANFDGENISAFENIDDINKKNERIAVGFDVMKKKLAGCHIIPVLDAAVADMNHWLGPATFHYTKEVYDYQYECINVINEKLPRDEEESRIRELQRKYTEYYYKTFFNGISSAFAESNRDKNREIIHERRRKEHAEMQADLLLEIALNAKNASAPADIGIKTAVVYGWTRVSELVLKLLADNGIKPVAVMENMDEKSVGEKYISGGLPVLKRGARMPRADCVIVCDLISLDRIMSRLKGTLDIPVYTAREFAKLVKAL